MEGNQFFQGQISVLHHSNGTRVAYNRYESYKQSEVHLTEEKSSRSTFGIHDNTYYLKLDKDKEIEMAVQCPFDKTFTFREIGSDEPDCIQCPYIEGDLQNEDSYLVAQGSQDTEC